MEFLHILPSKGLSGFFYLDMSLSRSIKKIRSLSSKLPNVKLIEESQTKRIIIDIPEVRLKLIFDELYQVLILIEIDLSPNSKPQVPIMFLHTLFNDYSDIANQLDLSKPTCWADSALYEFQGYSVVLKDSLFKFFIHKSKSFPLEEPSIKVRIYEVINNKVSIKHTTGKSEDISWCIYPESAIELFGTPDLVRACKDTSSFFYIYKYEGLDLFFEKNTLTEIIMHLNMPESIDFNEYDRCHVFIHFERFSINPLQKFIDFKDNLPNGVREISQKRLSHGFKPTTFYSSGRFMFEVLASGYLSSVSLRYFPY